MHVEGKEFFKLYNVIVYEYLHRWVSVYFVPLSPPADI